MAKIGKQIKALRDGHGWTQNDLAEISGVNAKYISAIEQGRRKPGKKTMTALCTALMTSEQEVKAVNSPLKLIFDLLSPLSESELWEWHLKIRKAQEVQEQEPT